MVNYHTIVEDTIVENADKSMEKWALFLRLPFCAYFFKLPFLGFNSWVKGFSVISKEVIVLILKKWRNNSDRSIKINLVNSEQSYF